MFQSFICVKLQTTFLLTFLSTILELLLFLYDLLPNPPYFRTNQILFERFLTDINQPNHIPACVQHRVLTLVPN